MMRSFIRLVFLTAFLAITVFPSTVSAHRRQDDSSKFNELIAPIQENDLPRDDRDFLGSSPDPTSRIFQKELIQNTVVNALGVVGIGLVWLQQITGAIGTPILVPFLIVPLFILGIALLFTPFIGEAIVQLVNSNINFG